MKLYHIKPNGQLHEAIELEYNHYMYLAECGVQEGDCDDEQADQARETADKLSDISGRMFQPGLTGEEIGWVKEIAAARAIRHDFAGRKEAI